MCTSCCLQIEKIVGKHGLVVISRVGSNPESFIYESDVLTKYKVSKMLNVFVVDIEEEILHMLACAAICNFQKNHSAGF